MKPFILITTLVFSAGAFAQEWVSVGAARTAAPSSQAPLIDTSQQARFISESMDIPATAAASGTLNDEIAWQVEQLQQEIASLRGLIEQQEYQIKKLQTEGQQRYLDLDERVAQLYQMKAAAPATPTVVHAPVATANSPAQVAVAQKSNADDDYQAAMSLVREKKYAEASSAFDSFIAKYPQHDLLGNALYWSGEIWLVQNNLPEALKQFHRILNDLPEHGKAADATYKIGVTLHRQHKNEEAKVWLNKVIKNYSGKADSTVNLAKSYLQRIE